MADQSQPQPASLTLPLFLTLFLSAVLMFAGMFHLLLFKTVEELNNGDLYDDDEVGDVPTQAWGTVSNSIITVIGMVLSEFDRDMFASKLFPESIAVLATLLFAVFISFVVIVMLNVLIAVVSDSYDYAMTRATQLFLRSKNLAQNNKFISCEANFGAIPSSICLLRPPPPLVIFSLTVQRVCSW